MTDDQDAVTLGELSRRLAAHERRMDQRFDTVNRRLDALQYVGKETYELQVSQMNQRVEALEEARRWTVRTLVAAFLYPLALALVVAIVMTR